MSTSKIKPLSKSMKVAIVSAPLVTKGGVFRSTCELVESARDKGLDWSALILTRGDLDSRDLPEGVEVKILERSGLRGLLELGRRLANHDAICQADAVISMIPQSDVMLALLKRRRSQIRVAFVRGAAWPRKGEANEVRRRIWRAIERWALSRMDEVWSTTPILRDDIEWPSAIIVPAGIAAVGMQDEGHIAFGENSVVWAARMSVDKNPQLFLKVMSELQISGTMYGDGELRQELETDAPPNVTFEGWADPNTLWNGAGIYLGTSHREAFGRSAVEAAVRGLPMVLSKAFGAAPLLFTDEELRDRFVLDPTDVAAWSEATHALAVSSELRYKVGSHVQNNAKNLTIAGSVDAVCARLDAIVDKGL